jgi:hypothetical protein
MLGFILLAYFIVFFVTVPILLWEIRRSFMVRWHSNWPHYWELPGVLPSFWRYVLRKRKD